LLTIARIQSAWGLGSVKKLVGAPGGGIKGLSTQQLVRELAKL